MQFYSARLLGRQSFSLPSRSVGVQSSQPNVLRPTHPPRFSARQDLPSAGSEGETPDFEREAHRIAESRLWGGEILSIVEGVTRHVIGYLRLPATEPPPKRMFSWFSSAAGANQPAGPALIQRLIEDAKARGETHFLGDDGQWHRLEDSFRPPVEGAPDP
ncbi:MAG: hypothetical protein SFZ03_07825 [Candidatus Melainabacteria bacterium]|nr:hypothetical protein [Candidatus Melainabacteria bacterium]